MARTTWKQVEREAAELIGAKRHWANAGEREDADSPHFACQVKNPKRLALPELERLVDEMTLRGVDHGKVPVVMVKRSAGAGVPTQMLVVLPAGAWKMVSALFVEWVTGVPNSEHLATMVREHLKELPGMRKRVEEYVAKSKARGRKPKPPKLRVIDGGVK